MWGPGGPITGGPHTARTPGFGSLIDEFGQERISEVRTFLAFKRRDADVQILYLIGHGLSQLMADQLRANPANDASKKSARWRWPLKDCENVNGLGILPSKVTSEAQRGNLVVFSSGFLSPEWVVEQLRKRDTCDNTIVIVIDSCYSGSWKTRISKSLSQSPLRHTRVLLQTASGPDEEAYGYFFTPLFCALQDVSPVDIDEVNKVQDSPVALQNPMFYDSKPDVRHPDSPTVNVKIAGLCFRFFNQHDFFRKFAYHYASRVFDAEPARGIPASDLSLFFESFGTASIKIFCFKLKKHRKSGTPMAFFLIKWLQSAQSTSKFFHLHLHFDSFRSPMKLTAVSHVDVTRCPHGTYEYEEKIDTKEYIYPSHSTTVWRNINRKLLPACKMFVRDNGHGISWDNPGAWDMHECHPGNMIRSLSRSAVFKELQPNISLEN